MTICHQGDSFIGPDLGGGGGGKMASSKEYLCLSAKRYSELVEGKREKVVISQMFRISSKSTKLSIILNFLKCLSIFKSNDQWHT